jgi:hypothetical protein
MTILLVLLGGLVGAAFGPIGLIAGSILGATFAHSVFDDDYEPQHFALDDEDDSAIFDSSFLDTYSDDFQINPATGLSMSYGGTGGFDVGGNPYGFDLSDDFGTDHSTFMDIESSGNPHDFL